MGKVKPPAEVYDEWSPEAKEGYQSQLDGMAKDRDGHMAAHDEELAKADRADQFAAGSKMAADDDQPKKVDDVKEGQGGAWVGNLVVTRQEKEKAKQHRANAEAEKQKADSIDSEINRLTINDDGKRSENPAKVKADYEIEARKNLSADREKYCELQKKQMELQQELNNTWFFGKDDLRQQIADLQKEMDEFSKDMAFNEQNLSNTSPEPPPPPGMPGTPPIQTFVGTGAKLSCPLAIPCGATLVVDPARMAFVDNKQMANIMDFKPLFNIPSMGQCTTMSNPAVAAATAAKLGVYTPAPCIPATTAPWKPGDSKVLVENFPALLNTDTLQCMWGGTISILPG